MLDRDLNKEEPEDILKRVTFTTDYNIFSNIDYMIENVTEKWDIKKDVFMKLDKICPEPCVFASNTSAIPIERIASVTKRRDKVIGLHFMNPATLKPTVEMIRGPQTSQETIEISKTLLSQIVNAKLQVSPEPWETRRSRGMKQSAFSGQQPT